MAHDRSVSDVKEGGCPECGSKIVEESRDRVPGGIDWHHLKCSDCNWTQTV